jgi:type 2 lantibiotic biosynthesis protein LanM
MPQQASTGLEPSLGCLIDPAVAGLAAQLGHIPGLGAGEADALCAGVRAQLTQSVLRKVSRVLLLELNAARLSGQLHAADPAGRWDEWLSATTQLSYWESLTEHYPSFLGRLRTVIGNCCAAALTLGARFAADRAGFARLPGAGPGDLTQVALGAGDSHNRGQTVAVLHTTAGRVLYKPRPVAVDKCLAGLLAVVAPAGEYRIRVPEALAGDGYGWAEYVEHRYCVDGGELRAFYLGIGHWLAVMRLVGGSDLHAENVIACGPVPVVVDCETLFTPHAEGVLSGYGLAHDHAAQLIADSPLRTGLLPGRGEALAWRGVDSSAAGQLPGQQPYVDMPVIVGAGTDEARLGYERQRLPAARNHPSPDPVLVNHWRQVVAGFQDMTARLAGLDEKGALAAPLGAFADCQVRVVVRNTETYMELSRMLWHPVSLHDEQAAVRRAAGLLATHASNASAAPGDPEVIAAEVAEMLDGDVPVFSTTPRSGRLTGPRGTGYGPARDLVADAVHRWRAIDRDLDLQVVSGTLVSAYLNEGVLPDYKPVRPMRVSGGDLDRRRRRVAASIMTTIRDAAIRAGDGTVTWIAPVISPVGWAVQPLSNDLYNGLSGVAVALAAYEFEVSQDRADPVSGLGSLLGDAVRSMRAIEDTDDRDFRGAIRVRPDAPGGYVGLGSLIWAWLLLGRLQVPGLTEDGAVARALIAAGQLSAAVEQDDSFDLFRGMSGAVVPLLTLAGRTGDPQWATLAGSIGARLVKAARTGDVGARWGTPMYEEGIGGAAHGATGIGWALARLAGYPAGAAHSGGGVLPAGAVPGEGEAEPLRAMAEAAFAFEESLYDPAAGGWTDLREPGHIAAAWCHGSGGIGIVAADLARLGGDRWLDVLRRAAACSWASGLGNNHTLCHGDLGVWEVVDLALASGAGPAGVDRDGLDARVVSSLGEHGPVSGLARDTLSPGLMTGIGGVAYQLLRMDPRSPLPSVLLPDPLAGRAGRHAHAAG